MQSTNFDEVLGLEEQFYDQGHQQGVSDGIKAGRIEGRTFGLEKGLEKYVQSGRLDGKSIVWANRLPQSKTNKSFKGQTQSEQAQQTVSTDDTPISHPKKIPALPDNQRLVKHITVLHALAESESLSTENTEEAVADFDDRLKRAQGKAKIVERMSGDIAGDPGS